MDKFYHTMLDISYGATTVRERMSRTTQQGVVSALLEAKYDTTLESFLTLKREQKISYENIARDLDDLTDGAVSITGETVRRWINDLEAVA